MPRPCPDCRYPLAECACLDESENVQTMDFGEALAVLKGGGCVTRASWADSDTFLYLVPGSVFVVNRPPLLGIYPEGTEIRYRAHIDIRAADGTCSPWQPSQDALMAEDWAEV